MVSAYPNAAAGARQAERVLSGLTQEMPRVDALYRDLHAHPELSLQEHRTAAAVAARLHRAGFAVTEGVGGTGVVGLLENGAGPVVMLRGDMDALPLREETGLPYASRVTTTDQHGREVPVMHACGHDIHTSCLVGGAALLARGREHWRGTLMVVAQPAEELVSGALAMLRAGLYARCARPDVILGQHNKPYPVGSVLHREGPAMAAATHLSMTIHGRGGHGAMPQNAIDPVVIAAHIVTRLQTIVAREVAPLEPAVITVGMLRAGTRGNVIPEQAYMELTVRSFNDQVQASLLAAIERVAGAEAAASAAPAPRIEVSSTTIVTNNDGATVRRVRAAHAAHFGASRVLELPQTTGSEDFPQFGSAASGGFAGPDIPYAYWGLGTVPRARWAEAEGATLEEKSRSVPGLHSPRYAPERTLTLRTGVEALVVASLAYLTPAG